MIGGLQNSFAFVVNIYKVKIKTQSPMCNVRCTFQVAMTD